MCQRLLFAVDVLCYAQSTTRAFLMTTKDQVLVHTRGGLRPQDTVCIPPQGFTLQRLQRMGTCIFEASTSPRVVLEKNMAQGAQSVGPGACGKATKKRTVQKYPRCGCAATKCERNCRCAKMGVRCSWFMCRCACIWGSAGALTLTNADEDDDKDDMVMVMHEAEEPDG